MKWDMLVASFCCTMLALVCYYLINYQVILCSTETILKVCMFFSMLLAGYALGIFIFDRKEK